MEFLNNVNPEFLEWFKSYMPANLVFLALIAYFLQKTFTSPHFNKTAQMFISIFSTKKEEENE